MHRGLVKLTWYIKIQTFAKSTEELWYEEWKSPYEHTVEVGDPKQFLESLKAPIQPGYELRRS
jgi:proteasome activator subunit 4